MGRKLCTITFEEIEVLTAEDYERKQLRFLDLRTREICHVKLTKYGQEIAFDPVKAIERLFGRLSKERWKTRIFIHKT